MTQVVTEYLLTPARPAWLTGSRARALAWAIILVVMAGHIGFLLMPGAIALTGDEAYYWEWSRNLSYSYYSKPALIALLIRASCAVLGDTEFAVRLPAVLLAGGSSGLAWLLTRKLFQNDRLALGVVGLFCCVPLLIAGSVLMTIDAPLFFLLALATTTAAIALLEHRPRMFLLTGLAMALAVLAKFSAPIWLVGFFGLLLAHRSQRHWLKTPWPWFLVGCAVVGYVPTIIWNTQHSWLTFRHVGSGILGEEGPHLGIGHVGEFLFAQMGLASPPVFALMIGGASLALRGDAKDPTALRLRYLLFVSAPLWLLPGMVGFWNKVQGNWTAPAYFGLTILAAFFTETVMRDRSQWKRWGTVVWAAVFVGAVTIVLTHHSQLVYQATSIANHVLGTDLKPQRLDLARRARGWRELGEAMGGQLSAMPAGTLVMAGDYQGAALAAFYTPGQPVTYRFGASMAEPARLSQYEVWPDRRLDQPELVGRDALIIMSRPGTDLGNYFESIEPLQTVTVRIAGLEVRTMYLFHGKGFRGMKINPLSHG